MSHFYGDITGGRGTATKGGTKNSGIDGHIRGWNVGARVSVSHNEHTGEDVVMVYATSGSGGSRQDIPIAKFTAATLDLCQTCSNFSVSAICEHGHANAILCQADQPSDYVPVLEDDSTPGQDDDKYIAEEDKLYPACQCGYEQEWLRFFNRG